MSVADAKKFISAAMNDSGLRRTLVEAECQSDRFAILADCGYHFSEEDYEEAFSKMMVDASGPEEIEKLRDFKQFIDTLEYL